MDVVVMVDLVMVNVVAVDVMVVVDVVVMVVDVGSSWINSILFATVPFTLANTRWRNAPAQGDQG